MNETTFLNAASWDEVLEALKSDHAQLADRGSAARSLLSQVVDKEAPFQALGDFAGVGIYEGALARATENVVTGIGQIADRPVMVIVAADDRPAAPLPPTLIRKLDRAQQIALENRLPVLYIVSSSGRYAPTDEEQFPDQNDWGRLAVTCSRLHARGVFQVTVSRGALRSDGPLAPLTVTAMVLASESTLKPDTLLGETNVVDCRQGSPGSWATQVRELFASQPEAPEPVFARTSACPPARDGRSIYGVMPLDPSYEYETRAVIDHLVDADSFVEYKAEYGRTIVCGYARIDGWCVGIIGNQKQHVHQPGQPIEVGGVIYPESADKGARFIMGSNQNRLPLLFLQDVNGFMVGRGVERAGIIRSGAKLVNAVANSVVPKLTLILGGSYGAGNYALCGRGYSPRFLYAWPTCRYGVMGGAQAARTLLALRVRQLERAGQEPDEATMQTLSRKIQESYERQLDPRYAAARLWVDAVIAPHETRATISHALTVVAHNTHLEDFKTGVLQV